jgi:type I restriction enzyme S subunit
MSEWKEYKLSDIMEIIGGGTPKTSESQYWNGNIPWLSVVDFNNRRKFVFETEKKITEKGLQESSTKMLKKGQIIISARGTVGALAVLGRDMTFNQSCYGLNAKEDLTFNDYLYYLVNYNVSSLLNNTHGAVFDTITRETFDHISVGLPPLPEQHTIASILSSLDDKIDLLHRQNKTLEALAETLFRQWFVEEAGEGWKTGKLGDVIETIESGSRPKGGIDPKLREGIPSIGAENINGLGYYDYSKTKFITQEFYNSMKRGFIKNYDILIYKDGAYIGRKGMFANGFPYDICTVNEHVFILRANPRVNQFFLYFLLNQEELEQLNANSAQPGLNQESMKSFEIVIPSNELIKKFEEIVKVWIDKIFFNSNQIHTLARLRDTLLPKLISGDVRIE